MYSDGPFVLYHENLLKERYYYYNPATREKEIEEKVIPSEKPVISLKKALGIEKEVFISTDYPNDPDEYGQISKIAAFGDIHGEFDVLIAVLKNNMIIDQQLKWSFGDGHIVFCGDIFDRGDQVTECLWFIYSLEQEAKKAGGVVHLILGNHELMAMEGDIRYLSLKYFNLVNHLKISYAKLFDGNTVLGRWLRSKNTVIKINDCIFVHGGLSQRIVRKQYNIKTINHLSRQYLLGLPVDEELVTGSEGPFWYRGYLMKWANLPLITKTDVDEILQFYAAHKIIFAHTPVSKIQPYFKHLIAIDVTLKKDSPYEFLWIENNKFSARGETGKIRDLTGLD